MADRYEHLNRLRDLGLNPSGQKNQQKVRCPKASFCKNPGAKNVRDACISINLDEGIYNCHKCGATGTVADKRSFENKQSLKRYKKPSAKGFTVPGKPIDDFFKARGISKETWQAFKIYEQGGQIVFPYLRNGKLVNYKKRDLKKKDFRQAGGAEAILFNYDRALDPAEVIIVEGEMDALAFGEAGFFNVTSPNQGAPNASDKSVDKKLECLDNSFEIFENKERIYLAVDNDENGRRLERELIRRLGAERCYKVDFGKHKDANEVLMDQDPQALKDLIGKAEPVPVPGIWTASDALDPLLDGFRNGKKKGETTFIKEIDQNFTWRTTDLSLWSGYNNEGKTTLLNQLLLLRAIKAGEKIAVFSPENFPAEDFYDDLIHTLVGKSTDKAYSNVMTEAEYINAIDFINDHFFLVHPEEAFEIDTLLDRFQYLVRRYGVRHVVVDPWNQIDHIEVGPREDLYISRIMTKFKRFAIANDVTFNVVAHQNPPRELGKDGNYLRPTKYTIKGGGTFSDKVDNVLMVWRPHFKTDKLDPWTLFFSEKIKKIRLVGHPGETDLSFSRPSNRYTVGGIDPFTNEIADGSKYFEDQETEDTLEEELDEDDKPF